MEVVPERRPIVLGGASGESASYAYDPGGNVLRIQSAVTSSVTVSGFQPTMGGPGQVVTVSGGGFCTSPSQNLVALAGIPATVTAGTANKLSFVVPPGATTGSISVTCGGSAAQSAGTFTVVSGVVVSDFTPKVGAAGTIIGITGYNFDPTPANDSVQVGGGSATVSSASLTSLQATTATSATSGKIKVTAGGSTGTSSADFFLVPTAYSAAMVGLSARVVPGVDAAVSLGTPGRIALAIFDGSQGEGLSLYVSGVTYIGSTTIALFTPAGAKLWSNTVSAGSTVKLVPPVLPMNGTYTVVIQPASGATGTLHLQVMPDVALPLTVGGDAVNMTLAAGQNGRCSFTANAGDALGVGYPSLSTTPAGDTVGILLQAPDGSYVAGSVYPNAPGSRQFPTLTTSGTYTLLAKPNGTSAATLSLFVSRPLTGTLATDGTPTTFQTARAGQTGTYTFSGSAGQSYTLRVTTGAAFAGGGTVTLKKPDGTSVTVANVSSAGVTDMKYDLGVLTKSGTYTVVVTPNGVSVGTLTMTLLPHSIGTLVVGDPALSVSMAAGQNGRYTFAGTAGEVLGLGFPTVSTTPAGGTVGFSVLKADGSYLGSTLNATGPGSTQLTAIPATATYTLLVQPTTPVAASVSLLLSRPLTGTLALDGTTTTYQTSRVGQAGTYTFSGASGQSYTLRLTSGAAFTGGGTVVIKKPDATTLRTVALSTTVATDAKADLGVLNATGTYTITITPAGVSVGSVGLQLIPYATEALAIADAPKAFTLTQGQNGRYTFACASGDLLSLTSSAFTTTPSGRTVIASVTSPTGASLLTAPLTGAGTVGISPVTATGTCILTLAPQDTAAASVTLQLARR